MPLMSNFEELEEFNKKHVNPVTGTIFKREETKMNNDRERIRERLDPEEIDEVSEEEAMEALNLKIDDMPKVTSAN